MKNCQDRKIVKAFNQSAEDCQEESATPLAASIVTSIVTSIATQDTETPPHNQ
jgi:hypothetical protein